MFILFGTTAYALTKSSRNLTFVGHRVAACDLFFSLEYQDRQSYFCVCERVRAEPHLFLCDFFRRLVRNFVNVKFFFCIPTVKIKCKIKLHHVNFLYIRNIYALYS